MTAAARIKRDFIAYATATLGGFVTISAGFCCAQLAGVPMPKVLMIAHSADMANGRADALMASQPDQARRLSLKILSTRPVDARAWLRLAVLDSPSGRPLSRQASIWLERSFEVGPYDPQVLLGRVVFAYDHWADLSDDLRIQTRRHLKAAMALHYQRRQLLEATRTVSNPSGRLTLGLDLLQFRVAADAAPPSSDIAGALDKGVPEN